MLRDLGRRRQLSGPGTLSPPAHVKYEGLERVSGWRKVGSEAPGAVACVCFPGEAHPAAHPGLRLGPRPLWKLGEG